MEGKRRLPVALWNYWEPEETLCATIFSVQMRERAIVVA